MNYKNINLLYQKLSKSNPEPRSELIYRNNFELLISVILSAQSTDKTVNSVTPTLFIEHPSPKAILRCGKDKLKTILKPIGSAPTKANNIIKTCQILIEQHNSIVPNTREALENLPGVGRKTASVILNEGFGLPTIAVDTHVFRVSNRTGLAKGNRPGEVEKQLLRLTPNKWKMNAHRFLIMHGRYVCKAKNFICSQCVIEEQCEYSNKVYK